MAAVAGHAEKCGFESFYTPEHIVVYPGATAGPVTFPPDRALPSIRTLQQTYGIADGTIQEALTILKAEGLVHTVRGRGVFVTSRT